MPNEALFREETIRGISEVLQGFGFMTIDTPAIEALSLLKAKDGIGEESKLIFEMKDEDAGLRYDNTIGLARYISMHQELPLPFKRYYVGKAWRREEPQRLRYREFTQVDFDIIGGDKARADAEIVGAGGKILDMLDLQYTVQISDRSVVELAFERFGLKKELFKPVARAVDKLDKVSEMGVVEALKALGLEGQLIDRIMELISMNGTNEEKLAYVERLLGEGDGRVAELRRTLTLLAPYSIKGKITVNFAIMRGLDYYTGIVFEFKLAGESSSVGGGGRYDELIGIIGGRSLPVVGMAFGLDRLLDLLKYSASTRQTYAEVFVACVRDSNYGYALQVANALRGNGIRTDVNLAERNLSNQFAYANSLKIKYVIVIGDAEEKGGVLKLRNMATGEEGTMNVDDAVKLIRGK